MIDEDDGRVQTLVRQVGQEEVGPWNDPLAYHGAIAVDDHEVRLPDRRAEPRPGPVGRRNDQVGSAAKALPALRNDPVVRGQIHALEDAAARGENGRRNHRSQDRSPPIHGGVVILRRSPELRPGKVFLGDDSADLGARFCNHRLEREGCCAITPVRVAGRVVDEEDLQAQPPTATRWYQACVPIAGCIVTVDARAHRRVRSVAPDTDGQ